jgi:hypothetical protein
MSLSDEERETLDRLGREINDASVRIAERLMRDMMVFGSATVRTDWRAGGLIQYTGLLPGEAGFEEQQREQTQRMRLDRRRRRARHPRRAHGTPPRWFR